MGIRMGIRQSETKKAPLVAFDFDGTLTVRDSFVAFLEWHVGALAFLVKAPGLAPAAIGCAAPALWTGGVSFAWLRALASMAKTSRRGGTACWSNNN